MRKSGPPIKCNCEGCVSRRNSQRGWRSKNPEKALKHSKASNEQRKKARRDNSPEVSDEELDRRAQEL